LAGLTVRELLAFPPPVAGAVTIPRSRAAGRRIFFLFLPDLSVGLLDS